MQLRFLWRALAESGDVGRWVLVAEYALSAGLVRGVWDQSCLGELHLVRPRNLIWGADVHMQ